MFRKLRIAVLLVILATVALGAWRSGARATEWKHTLYATVYPIAADDSPHTRAGVARLSADDFAPITDWLQDEVRRHGRDVLRPLAISVAPPLESQPPPFPADGGPVAVGLWSLQLRFWAWRHDATPGPRPDVRLFVLYHDPARTPQLDHSVGLRKGQIGIVKAFAGRDDGPRNAVVIAHELLHTLGASDKYDPQSLAPIFPDGYAEPDRQPSHPQRMAEIMAGRFALADGQLAMPERLGQTLIGPRTAAEIGLRRAN